MPTAAAVVHGRAAPGKATGTRAVEAAGTGKRTVRRAKSTGVAADAATMSAARQSAGRNRRRAECDCRDECHTFCRMEFSCMFSD